MYTIGMAEVLTDIMTVNPVIRTIPSASSILDTSNFTFYAVTYGKDAHGFEHHGHTIGGESEGPGGIIYNNGVIEVQSNTVSTIESYIFSAVYSAYSSTYSSLPQYPSIFDRRLENGSTLRVLTFSSTGGEWVPQDLGHYINPAIDQNYSSIWNVVGGFAPIGNIGQYHFATSNEVSIIVSGNISSVFNEYGLVDRNGFIRINPQTSLANPTTASSLFSGCLITSSTTIGPSKLKLWTCPMLGDFISLALFGGITHIGIWCLDLKGMLAEGLNPPYSWDVLDTSKRYKLVAKVTSLDNLLYHIDPPGFSGLKDVVDTIAFKGPLLTLVFQF